MFKAQLQELCQKHGWYLPEYQTSKGGHDHEPRFLAKVIVNGQTFVSPGEARSSKVAQNDAARAAFLHFTSPAPAPSLYQPQAEHLLLHSDKNSNLQGFASERTVISRNVPEKWTLPIEIGAPNNMCMIPEAEKCANTLLQDFASGRKLLDKTPLPMGTTVELSAQSDEICKMTGTGYSSERNLGTVHPAGFGKSNQMSEIIDAEPTKRRIQAYSLSPSGEFQNLQEPKVIQSQTNNCKATPAENGDTTFKAPNMCKNRLQEYCQKNAVSFPVYGCERVGPDHCSRFKGKVTFNGRTFESEYYFSSLKEAESDAAKIALMSISTNEMKVEECNFKNLLQEYAQKCRYGLPVYNHSSTGDPHKMTFVSTVKIGNHSFTGQGYATKKAADMSAAKVAYASLMSRKTHEAERLTTTHQPNQSPAELAAFVQATVQPKMDRSASSSHVAVNSEIQRLLEENPLYSKGRVIHPRKMEVSLPKGGVQSPRSNEKWVVSTFDR